MGRSVIGIPPNDFCIHCGKSKDGRVWVCQECQLAHIENSSGFWSYVQKTKDIMWFKNEER